MDVVRVASLWEENQEFLKQNLGRCLTESHGARWVLMPESPFPRFNHVSRVRLQDGRVDDFLEETRAFFRLHGIPTNCILVTPATVPESLSAYLYRLGFTTEYNSVMLHRGHQLPFSPPYIHVEKVPVDRALLVFDLIRQVFLPGASPLALASGHRAVQISYDIEATHFVAFWGTRPAGAGMLFRRGSMGGIYNMCTLPEFRGRGVATAIVSSCIREAYQAGCEFVGLTPTVMGRPLYERLGFDEVYQERYYIERL